MTITKNDFFTANNFKTLQDIGKKYPEWKDFCMDIVNQMDDKFGVTMLSETSGEIEQLVFVDYNMAQSTVILGLAASELQKDKLYLYKMHSTKDGNIVDFKSSELFNTGVNCKLLSYTKGSDIFYGDERLSSITIQNDDTFNVGDTLISLDTWIANEEGDDIRYDYNGAMYEVAIVQDKTIYLRAKDKINTPFKETQTLYLYNRAK